MAEYLIIAVVVVAAITVLILNKRKKKSKKEGADVPQGLQVFDEKGNITLDLTDRLTKVLGTIEANGSNVSIHDKRILNNDVWFCLYYMHCDVKYPTRKVAPIIPTIYADGEYIKCEYSGSGYKANVKYIYGVY